MTDLPELQHLLIEAAGRRSLRRRRARGSRSVALVAAAALAVVAIPRGVSDDVELPAVTPTPSATPEPATIEQAYGALRRPERAADHVKLFGQARGSTTRLLAKDAGIGLYLAVKPGQVCLITADLKHGGAGTSCSATRLYLSAARLHGSIGSRPSAAFAFTDGVREVTLTLADGGRLTRPVTNNGVIVAELPARVTRVDWRGGDGRAYSAAFVGGQPLTGADAYVALSAPPGAAGELPGLPGSRQVARTGAVSAWLVPRRDAVCLVVRAGPRTASGCRQPLRISPRPIVVAVAAGDGTRAVAAAFADLVTRFEVTPPAGVEHGGALLWTDRGETRSLHFRDAARGPASETLPTGIDGFVLDARAQDPKTLPDP